jgi:hypothetical protein
LENQRKGKKDDKSKEKMANINRKREETTQNNTQEKI